MGLAGALTPDQAAALRKQLGITPARPGRPPAQDPPQLVDAIRTHTAAGRGDRLIGAELGMPRATVARVRYRHNIPAGGRNGRPRKTPPQEGTA